MASNLGVECVDINIYIYILYNLIQHMFSTFSINRNWTYVIDGYIDKQKKHQSNVNLLGLFRVKIDSPEVDEFRPGHRGMLHWVNRLTG